MSKAEFFLVDCYVLFSGNRVIPPEQSRGIARCHAVEWRGSYPVFSSATDMSHEGVTCSYHQAERARLSAPDSVHSSRMQPRMCTEA